MILREILTGIVRGILKNCFTVQEPFKDSQKDSSRSVGTIEKAMHEKILARIVLPLYHRLLGVCGEVVSARVAMLRFERELLEEALVTVATARTHHPRRQQDRSQHLLLFWSYQRKKHQPFIQSFIDWITQM